MEGFSRGLAVENILAPVILMALERMTMLGPMRCIERLPSAWYELIVNNLMILRYEGHACIMELLRLPKERLL